MRISRTARHSVAISVAAFGWLQGFAAIADEQVSQLPRGEELFVHRWQANDPASPQGDGLGPMFNDRSCVACHNQGGVGGAGTNDHNVDLLSVDLASSMIAGGEREGAFRQTLAKALSNVHRGLTNDPATTVLHRSSTVGRYREWRDRLAPPLPLGQATPVRELTPEFGVVLQLSQRNTPALFGASEIDALPQGVLQQVAQRQHRWYPQVAGRVAQSSPERPEGRFGWRGQAATLKDFVRGACAAELGLQLAGNPQSANPLEPISVRERSTHDTSRHFDMPEVHARQLVLFVAGLPRPQQALPREPQVLAAVKRGELVFKSTGCAICHIRKLGPIDGIFSDLLLHDMGDELADLGVAASSPSGRHGSGYGSSNGFSILVFQPDPKKQREWRTPPLWGVRDSAPYLHDGRAGTLREAIALHGGQGEEAAKKFAALDDTQYAQLMLFLDTLVAPGGEF